MLEVNLPDEVALSFHCVYKMGNRRIKVSY